MINVREQQTVVSQQLAILRRAKIVSNLRKGKSVYYFINYDQVKHIEDCVSSILGEEERA
jgi:DNA-binding transcriptional ArsR family regulator